MLLWQSKKKQSRLCALAMPVKAALPWRHSNTGFAPLSEPTYHSTLIHYCILLLYCSNRRYCFQYYPTSPLVHIDHTSRASATSCLSRKVVGETTEATCLRKEDSPPNDDFQYGRDGHKNRPSGRYPLRIWSRICDHGTSAALPKGSNGESDTATSGRTSTIEGSADSHTLGSGQSNCPLMPERPSVSQMQSDLAL
jgi:hypothetical protein